MIDRKRPKAATRVAKPHTAALYSGKLQGLCREVGRK